jgi:hypothetical protein
MSQKLTCDHPDCSDEGNKVPQYHEHQVPVSS